MLLKIAAACSWFLGLGFGLPCLYGTWYLARHGEVWTFLGFPTYGKAFFADHGIETSVPLLLTFLVVCVAELLVGWLLWQQSLAGEWLGLAILPVELVFWVGFALPFAFVLGALRTVLILVALSPLAQGGGPSST
jgi:hypothetical protein